MLCPSCEADEAYKRHGGPVVMVDGTILRRHRCLNCRTLFISAQRVVHRVDAERLLDQVEPWPAPEISGSLPTPGDSAISATDPLDYPPTTEITA